MIADYIPSAPRRFSPLSARLGALLQARGLTVATAESCTGGTIASMLTQVAGSSAWFKGSVVSYAVEVKERVLGVDVSHGVVSEPTACQMAEGVARLLQTDAAVATTGVAGPGGGTPTTPVGTVCIAACLGGHTRSVTRRFEGDREAVILQAADAALALLGQIIEAES